MPARQKPTERRKRKPPKAVMIAADAAQRIALQGGSTQPKPFTHEELIKGKRVKRRFVITPQPIKTRGGANISANIEEIF